MPLVRELEPPRELLTSVLLRIDRERRRDALVRLVAFGTVLLVSVLLIIPAVQYATSEFYASGFYDYASLFFDGFAHGYWPDIMYSLSTSLPSFALLMLIAIGSTFIWSMRRTNRYAKIVFMRSALAA